MSKTLSKKDVGSHKTKDDLWIIVDEDVYDLTKFQDEHPGGQKSRFNHTWLIEKDLISFAVLQRVAGKDASKQFWKYHNEGILKKYKGQLQVGSLDTKKPEAPPTPPPTPPTPPRQEKETAKPVVEPGTVSVAPAEGARIPSEPLDAYGDLVPYGDPSWYQTVSLSTSYHFSVPNQAHSITLPTTTKHMPPYAMKSVTGWLAKSSPT